MAVQIHAQIIVTNVANINNAGGAGYLNASDIAVSGNFAYLANGTDGLRIYDISNPTNPINVGHAPSITNGTVWGVASGVAVVSNLVYLATGSDGLRIYDVSTPTNPINVGYIPSGGWSVSTGIDVGPAATVGVAVSGNYAYLADGQFGLRIYDISNPSNPINVGNYTNNYADGFNSPNSTAVAISGNYAYLASWIDGLRIFDISNPSSPTNVAHIGITTEFVTVSGNNAYIGNNNSNVGLEIYDISNPINPIFIKGMPGLSPNNVTISGNYAYVADDDLGLIVYDISNPANPIQVGDDVDGFDPDPDYSWQPQSIAVSGNYAYVANYYGMAVEMLIPQTSISLATVISWPATSTNYVLQQNSDLATTNWMCVTNPLIFSGGRGIFIAQPTTGNMFYRLISR